MWTYEQKTGRMLHDGVLVWVGYSGHGEGKNNPDMQHIPNVGPIPVGRYRIIKPPFNHSLRGPHCLRLEPLPGNQMFGRNGFLIHGDSTKAPGTASHGCICKSPLSARKIISEHEDCELEVVRGGVAIEFVDERGEVPAGLKRKEKLNT